MDLLLFTWVVVATLSTHTHVEGSVLKNLMHLEPRSDSCATRNKKSRCDVIGNRFTCLTTTESRHIEVANVQIEGSPCSWCPKGCEGNSGNKCEPSIYLEAKSVTGFELCYTKCIVDGIVGNGTTQGDCSINELCEASGECKERCTTDSDCTGTEKVCKTPGLSTGICIKCFVNGEAGDGSTQGDCGANQVCNDDGKCADTAPCCTSWDASCHTVSNENSNNHACEDCAGDPCYADCSSDAASNACKDCCIAAVHYRPWNCPACPCQNGGYCTGADLDNDGQEDCDCTAAVGFEGATCEASGGTDAANDETSAQTVRLHFNETCCEAKGVPEDCMGLCREKVESRSILDRNIQMVLPVDQCVEHEDAIKTCMIEEAIHCEWDDWEVMGDCSATCGTGTKTNTRVKSVEEENGGTCSGQDTEVVTCNTNPCPIDCLWNEWKIGMCDKSCGGGTRTDIRVQKVDVKHGGQECTGDSTVTESCNVQECPVVFHFNETCCVASGVPESCMGLCREKLPDRQIEVIMPIDQCAQYSDTVRSCLYSEGGESISDHANARSFDEHSLGMPVSQMLVVGTINN